MPPQLGPMPAAEQLATLVQPVPPLVTLRGEDQRPLTAAILTWGWADLDGHWYAGICFVFNTFRGSPLTALISVWAPTVHVTKRAGEHYGLLPRVRLTGPPQQWPALPGRYPKASQEWLTKHIHSSRFDVEGEYRDLWPEIRRR